MLIQNVWRNSNQYLRKHIDETCDHGVAIYFDYIIFLAKKLHAGSVKYFSCQVNLC